MKKPDMPDLSSIKDKLKIDKILNTIADVVDGNKPMSGVDANDALGNKIAELDKLVCDLLKVHKQHASDLSQIHTLLKEVFDDVNQLRGEFKSKEAESDKAKSAKTKSKKETVVEEEPKAEAKSGASGDDAEGKE